MDRSFERDANAKRRAYWEHFEHQADMGVRGVGKTRACAFEQAAQAMVAVITDLNTIADSEVVEISCAAPDRELLLVDWLNALIYEMTTKDLLFARFEVQLDGNILSGKAWGERTNIAKHQPAVEIKGATYTELKVTQRDDGRWMAQCVVDV